jgi:hypothetical protein
MGGMNEVTLRRRIVALVVAALLSVAGASTTAALSADDAEATTIRCYGDECVVGN